MPGFARPIEFSIPASVSAIRTGAFPPRGSGVIVLVTKPSSDRATSGALRASRQPEALSSTEHRTLDAEPLQLAVQLDGAAIARAVAAGHRRLPGELGVRHELAQRGEHRLRTTGEHVVTLVGQERRHVGGFDAHLGAGEERGRLRVQLAAEAEKRWRAAELLREVWERRDSDSAADQERPLDVEVEAVPER